jgi:GTP 3',8-cyclase
MKNDITDQLGRPLRDLRISVTDRCNFRCTYCMPKEHYDENYEFLSRKEYLSFEEIERLVRVFVRFGVAKVRLTGGEPLLRKNLAGLIGRIRRVVGIDDIAMTTNGYLLKDQALQLKNAGLNRVTVSLDSLDDSVFGTINGMEIGTRRTLDGIERAAESGLDPVKINVVVQRHVNDDCIMDLVGYARDTGHNVRFIEYMDVGTCNRWKYAEVVPSAEIKERIEKSFALIPLKKQYAGEVADRYAFAGSNGEIGFISSVSQPFCRDCSRARISADGQLYTCLFAENGTDLKSLLRSGADDEMLYNTIKSVWEGRSDRYSEERDPASESPVNKIEMYHIGG